MFVFSIHLHFQVSTVNMGDFYITLQSDSSSDHFEHNKISDFRNWLASSVKVDPYMYEVALVECIYPATRIRFPSQTKLYTLYFKENAEKEKYRYFMEDDPEDTTGTFPHFIVTRI